jgi:hypothetical protein
MVTVKRQCCSAEIAGIDCRNFSRGSDGVWRGATAGSGAWAQQAIDSGTSAVVLQEVVTAQKREEKLHDVNGVTAITSEELQAAIVSLEDCNPKCRAYR